MLHHGDTLSPRVANAVEDAARRAGLPLSALDLLTQDHGTALSFLEAARRGEAVAFVEKLDLAGFERALAARRRRAPFDAPPGGPLAL